MMLLNAASRCHGWKPEMMDWIVVSVSATLNTYAQIPLRTVQMELAGPWNVTQSNRILLDFDYNWALPSMGGAAKTLAQMDRMLCPEGAIYIWDEQPYDEGLVYRFARFNPVDIVEIKAKEAIMAEEDRKIFGALRPEGTISVWGERPVEYNEI